MLTEGATVDDSEEVRELCLGAVSSCHDESVQVFWRGKVLDVQAQRFAELAWGLTPQPEYGTDQFRVCRELVLSLETGLDGDGRPFFLLVQ